MYLPLWGINPQNSLSLEFHKQGLALSAVERNKSNNLIKIMLISCTNQCEIRVCVCFIFESLLYI